MEDVAFEVQPGEPAALPNRPKNRHKRERDVSHLCPTSVRLAQRKDELLKAWRDRKSSASSGSSHCHDDDSHGKKSKREGKCGDEKIPVSTNASSETDDSKDEEYTVSDEDDYSKNGVEIRNDVPKITNDSSDDECCKDIDCSSSSSSSSVTNVDNQRHRW